MGPTPGVDAHTATSVAKLGLGMLITAAIVIAIRLINRVLYLILLIGAGNAISEEQTSKLTPGLAIAGIGGLIMLVLSIVGLVIVLANTVLSVIAAVQSSGKARVAAIVSALTPLLGWILGVVLGIVIGVIGYASGTAGALPLWTNYASLVTETVVTLLVAAALLYGAVTVRNWGRARS